MMMIMVSMAAIREAPPPKEYLVEMPDNKTNIMHHFAFNMHYSFDGHHKGEARREAWHDGINDIYNDVALVMIMMTMTDQGRMIML